MQYLFSGVNGLWTGAAAVGLVGAAAIGVVALRGPVDTPPSSEPVTAAMPADEEAPQVQEEAVAVAEEAPKAEEETAAVAKEAPEAKEEAAATVPAPRFDEVRREADGVTVIAGQAVPGSEITVLQNGAAVAQATADAAGKFATIAFIPPDGKGHVLSLLQAADGSNQPSEDEIILAPLTVAAAAPAELQPKTLTEVETTEVALSDEQVVQDTTLSTAELAGDKELVPAAEIPEAAPEAETVDVAAAPTETAVEETATQAAEAPVETAAVEVAPQIASLAPQSGLAPTEGTAPTAPAASSDRTTAVQPAPQAAAPGPAPALTAVLQSTAQGVERVGPSAAELIDNVAIDIIGYSEQGDVQLSGRAQSAADSVRVYLDNQPIAQLEVDPEGRWRGDLPEVDAGIYTLRVDELTQVGEVSSRVETPFKREEPAVLAAAQAETEGPISAVTVQQGTTLWAIARDRYGEGALYVRVFEANREAIRDPDLIYPGQVFDLPD